MHEKLVVIPIRGSFLPLFVASYKGFASNEKVGIQIHRSQPVPRTHRSVFL
jgi:hypothetical protein